MFGYGTSCQGHQAAPIWMALSEQTLGEKLLGAKGLFS